MTDSARTNNTQLINKESETQRRGGVELLRIIAIFLICMSHAVQTARANNNFGNVISNITLEIMSNFGQIGNILFIICSSWFLVDSKKVKGEKVFKILLDSMAISVIILLSFIIVGYDFTFGEIIVNIFPDFYGLLWFIPTYVLFYMVHPLLNHIINSISKKTHFTFLFIISSLL